MERDERIAEISKIFQGVDDNQRQLILPLIEEAVFLEGKMTELKKLPFVSVNPKNPALQKLTPAAKLYKECTQSYMNAIRILSSILRKVEASAAEELEHILEEFQ